MHDPRDAGEKRSNPGVEGVGAGEGGGGGVLGKADGCLGWEAAVIPASLADDVEDAGDLAAVGDGDADGDDSKEVIGGLRRSVLILAGSTTTRVSAGIAKSLLLLEQPVLGC